MQDHLRPAKTYNFWRPNEDSTAVVSNYRKSFQLNRVGRDVWDLLDGSTDLSTVAARLSKKYEADYTMVRRDVSNLVQFLHTEGLVVADYDPLFKLGRSNPRLTSRLGDMVVGHDGQPIDAFDALIVVPPTPKFETIVLRRLHEFPPVGPMYLAASANEKGIRVGVLDLWSHSITYDQLSELIDSMSANVIGFSVMTENYLNGVRMAEFVKATNPEAVVAFGGPHASLLPEEVLSTGVVDACFVSESERSFISFLASQMSGSDAWETIPGILFRRGSRVMNNGHPGYERDLDRLARPALSPASRKNSNYAVISSARGCPFACKFCSAGKLSGNSYRFRSPANVVAELSELVRAGVTSAGFVDDTITVIPSRIREICTLITEQKLPIRWSAESRVDFASKHLSILEAMARAGCTTLQFGIEAADNDRLKRMDKRITKEEIEIACRNANTAGLRVTGSMVIGVPGDDEKDIDASFDFADHLQAEFGAMMVIGWFVPYPGTYYLENLARLGARFVRDLSYDSYNSLYPNVVMNEWSEEKIDRLRRTYFDRVIRLMSSSGLSAASDHYDLDALGQRNPVSSIS